jgi:hypothetical protein
MTVVGDDAAPVIYQANVTTIRASLFNGTPATGTFVADISNVTSARLFIRKNYSGGQVLIDKIATLDGTTAYSTWAAGTKQHFSFALSAVETNQTLPSDGTLDIYAVIEIVTATGPIAIGHFNGTITYDGITGVGTPTLPNTGAQSANRVFAGPTSGADALPTFRVIGFADLAISVPIKTSNYTAVKGDRLLANTTAGAFTITLPSGPTVGDAPVEIMDAQGTFATNNLTVGRNGQLIDANAGNLICNVNGVELTLLFVGGVKGWSVYGR